ncbi:KptA family-domain-containing protein [Tuber borchii]|uniref:2'-phosphotransferase n=1 Tax=Tuber borchii TaxID=42251 RepID=A0A2T6ZKI2_TUBBO|nr:KptA family-domain-containing protein [Tuber borchii]
MPTIPRLFFTPTIQSALLPTTTTASAAASIPIPRLLSLGLKKQMSTTTHHPRGNGLNRPPNPASEIRTISKALSYTLRHGAVKEGLTLQDDGYANVAELLQIPKFRKMNLTLEKLRQVVSENDKQRFSLTSTATTPSATAIATTGTTEATATTEDLHTYLIRATQGHSIPLADTSALLTPLPPNITSAVHGTFYPAYEAILACGYLSRMGRTHIHLATGEVGVKSGMRADAQVLFYVDVERARREGSIEFLISENGVALTAGDELGRLGLEFVDRVVSKSLGVLWEGGRVVKELPEEVKGGGCRLGRGIGGKGRGGRGRGGGRGGSGGGDRDAEEGTSRISVVDP